MLSFRRRFSTCSCTKYRPDWETGDPLDIALVGFPSDLGLTQRTGARHGPREMRNQSANVLYYNYSMFDLLCLVAENRLNA